MVGGYLKTGSINSDNLHFMGFLEVEVEFSGPVTVFE